MSPTFKNIALILGTTIGAGIFSLPIALNRAGFSYFIFLLVALSIILAKVNQFYREIIDHTAEKHQLPGYVRILLGEKWAKVAVFLLLFSTFGALLAYLIIGGEFVGKVIGTPAKTSSLYFYGVIVVLMVGVSQAMETLDVLFTILKITLLSVIIGIGISTLDISSVVSIPSVGTNFIPVYGAVLFSLTGFSIMPELKRDEHVKQSIYSGQLIVFVLYLLFSVGMYSQVVNGEFVFKNAVTSLIFNSAGIMTVMTPYLLLSWVAYDLFRKDLKLKRNLALPIVLVVPLVLFFLGIDSFLSVISLTGALFLGSIGILVCKMYQKKFPGKQRFILRAIQAVFLLGIFFEIIQFIF